MNDKKYIPRAISNNIREALEDTPVALLAGPRQTGKTTLVKKIGGERRMQYFTLDDNATLLSVQNDPVGFLREVDTAIIDEIQRAPELLLALKKSVDEDRRAGRFILTGSANLMAIPKVADSLAGRMETLRLYPLSQSEIHRHNHNWVDAAFAGNLLHNSQPIIGSELVDIVLRGGYPEMINRATTKRRDAWATQYIDALMQRDVQDIAQIDKLEELPRLLTALAHHAGQMCNFSKLGTDLRLNSKTTATYTNIFEQMFLLKRVPPWAKTGLKRLVKTPKLQFIDSGLLASLMSIDSELIQEDRSQFGHILETFIYGELLKYLTTANHQYRISYYRDTSKLEVDFIIENKRQQMIAIELKASATIKESDFNGLRKLQEYAGKKFVRGILLYDGEQALPMGDNIWAVPISSLWGEATH